MELFLLEHKKLWRKRIVKICVLLCFIYTVIFGSILSFQWFGFGSSDDYTSAFGNNFDGYGMIRESQEYALTFGEELTDETLQQLVRDYQQLEAAGMEKELEKTDWRIINSWLGTLYPELRETGTYQSYINQGYSQVKAERTAKEWVALPGTSEHQLGIAVDINADKSKCSNEDVYGWLAENAYKYGFVLRYPPGKQKITGTSYEPWHYRYVGEEAAKEIYERGICLEEYFKQMIEEVGL